MTTEADGSRWTVGMSKEDLLRWCQGRCKEFCCHKSMPRSWELEHQRHLITTCALLYSLIVFVNSFIVIHQGAPALHSRTSQRHVKSPATHTYVAIFKLGIPFDRGMMPWKCCDDISNCSWVIMLTDRRTKSSTNRHLLRLSSSRSEQNILQRGVSIWHDRWQYLSRHSSQHPICPNLPSVCLTMSSLVFQPSSCHFLVYPF